MQCVRAQPICASEGQTCGWNNAQTQSCCDDMECKPLMGGSDMQCVKKHSTCVAQGEYCGGPGQRTLECCSGSCQYPPNSDTMVCRDDAMLEAPSKGDDAMLEAASTGHHAMLEAASTEICTDTPNWNNGYSRCVDDSLGHWPFCEASKGWTCAGYAAKGWCKSDKCLSPSETGGVYACGDKLDSPELNCCACGGGSKQPSPPTCASEGQSCGWNNAQTQSCCDDMECKPLMGGSDMQCVKKHSTCVAQGEYCGGPGQRTLECCSGSCQYPPNSDTMVCRDDAMLEAPSKGDDAMLEAASTGHHAMLEAASTEICTDTPNWN